MTRCHTLLLLSVLLTSGLQAMEVGEILAKARAILGTEQKLNAVKTLQYEGRVYGADGEQQDSLDLTFKKPNKQMLIVESDKMKRSTGVNGFEGFVEVIDKTDTRRSGIVVLDYNRVRHLMANSAENLYFFEGPYHRPGGSITYEGTQTVRGKECYKLRFAYACGLYYIRYFDMQTFALVSTINGENNQELIESETQTVGGIVFPSKVETYDEEGDLIRTVVFEKILINEQVDDSVFDFPEIPSSLKP